MQGVSRIIISVALFIQFGHGNNIKPPLDNPGTITLSLDTNLPPSLRGSSPSYNARHLEGNFWTTAGNLNFQKGDLIVTMVAPSSPGETTLSSLAAPLYLVPFPPPTSMSGGFTAPLPRVNPPTPFPFKITYNGTTLFTPTVPGNELQAGQVTLSTDGGFLLFGLFEQPPGTSTNLSTSPDRRRSLASLFYDDSLWTYIEAPRGCVSSANPGGSVCSSSYPIMYGGLGDPSFNTWMCMTEIMGTPQLWSVPSTGLGQKWRYSNCRGVYPFGGNLLVSTQYSPGVDDDFVVLYPGLPLSRSIQTARTTKVSHAFSTPMLYMGVAAWQNSTSSTSVFVASLSHGLLHFKFNTGALPTPRNLKAEYEVWVPGCIGGPLVGLGNGTSIASSVVGPSPVCPMAIGDRPPALGVSLVGGGTSSPCPTLYFTTRFGVYGLLINSGGVGGGCGVGGGGWSSQGLQWVGGGLPLFTPPLAGAEFRGIALAPYLAAYIPPASSSPTPTPGIPTPTPSGTTSGSPTGSGSGTGTPSGTVSPTSSPTPSPVPPTPTSTGSGTPTPSPTPTLSMPTTSDTPSITPTPSTTLTLGVTPSDTPSHTPTPSATTTFTPTPTPSTTLTSTPTSSSSTSPTGTPTGTFTGTPTGTSSSTPSLTPSITPSPSPTPSTSPSPTLTPPITPTPSPPIAFPVWTSPSTPFSLAMGPYSPLLTVSGGDTHARSGSSSSGGSGSGSGSGSGMNTPALDTPSTYLLRRAVAVTFGWGDGDASLPFVSIATLSAATLLTPIGKLGGVLPCNSTPWPWSSFYPVGTLPGSGVPPLGSLSAALAPLPKLCPFPISNATFTPGGGGEANTATTATTNVTLVSFSIATPPSNSPVLASSYLALGYINLDSPTDLSYMSGEGGGVNVTLAQYALAVENWRIGGIGQWQAQGGGSGGNPSAAPLMDTVFSSLTLNIAPSSFSSSTFSVPYPGLWWYTPSSTVLGGGGESLGSPVSCSTSSSGSTTGGGSATIGGGGGTAPSTNSSGSNSSSIGGGGLGGGASSSSSSGTTPPSSASSSTGAIAGGVIGGLAALGLLAGGVFLARRFYSHSSSSKVWQVEDTHRWGHSSSNSSSSSRGRGGGGGLATSSEALAFGAPGLNRNPIENANSSSSRAANARRPSRLMQIIGSGLRTLGISSANSYGGEGAPASPPGTVLPNSTSSSSRPDTPNPSPPSPTSLDQSGGGDEVVAGFTAPSSGANDVKSPEMKKAEWAKPFSAALAQGGFKGVNAIVPLPTATSPSFTSSGGGGSGVGGGSEEAMGVAPASPPAPPPHVSTNVFVNAGSSSVGGALLANTFRSGNPLLAKRRASGVGEEGKKKAFGPPLLSRSAKKL